MNASNTIHDAFIQAITACKAQGKAVRYGARDEVNGADVGFLDPHSFDALGLGQVDIRLHAMIVMYGTPEAGQIAAMFENRASGYIAYFLVQLAHGAIIIEAEISPARRFQLRFKLFKLVDIIAQLQLPPEFQSEIQKELIDLFIKTQKILSTDSLCCYRFEQWGMCWTLDSTQTGEALCLYLLMMNQQLPEQQWRFYPIVFHPGLPQEKRLQTVHFLITILQRWKLCQPPGPNAFAQLFTLNTQLVKAGYPLTAAPFFLKYIITLLLRESDERKYNDMQLRTLLSEAQLSKLIEFLHALAPAGEESLFRVAALVECLFRDPVEKKAASSERVGTTTLHSYKATLNKHGPGLCLELDK